MLVISTVLFVSHLNLICAESVGKFLWFSDVYLDPNYHKNCRPPEGHQRGRFGSPNCDSPMTLLGITLTEVTDTLFLPTPDFIVFTGGTASSQKNKTFDDIDLAYKLLTDTVADSFPSVPFFPVIGLSDVTNQRSIPANANPLYVRVAAKYWSQWLSTHATGTVNDHGYYTEHLSDKLTLVALNTNIYLRTNKNGLVDGMHSVEIDPGDQFLFLIEELNNARKEKRRVILIGHTAPGKFERRLPESLHHQYRMWDVFNQRLLEIIEKHRDVIAVGLFGQTHSDSFRLMRSSSHTDPVVVYTAPSIAPWTPDRLPTEPRFRIVSYDRDTGNLLDYDQYRLDLKFANEQDKRQWKLEYSFQQQFSRMDPASMRSFYDTLSSSISNSKYREYCAKSTGLSGALAMKAGCFGNDNAKRFRLCTIGNVKFDGIDDCMSSFPWAWIIGSLVVVAIAIVLIFLTLRKVHMTRKRANYVRH